MCCSIASDAVKDTEHTLLGSGGLASWFIAIRRQRRCIPTLKDRRDGIVNPLEPNELQLGARSKRNLVEVTAIPRGQHYSGQARGCRRDNFFFDATDRK